MTTNFIEIQWIIKEYYEQWCANKLDNLEEMDKSLGRPKLTEEEIKKSE